MGKSPASRWNFLRENSKLKGVISQRISERGLSQADISNEIGINIYDLKHYLEDIPPNLTNIQIMYLCKILGIEVDLDIEFADQTVGIP